MMLPVSQSSDKRNMAITHYTDNTAFNKLRISSSKQEYGNTSRSERESSTLRGPPSTTINEVYESDDCTLT